MDAGKQYRFRLEPFMGSKNRQKHICPGCGQRSLVRYMDTVTGEYIADECGRCDHECGCGYHLTPREYFARTGNRPQQFSTGQVQPRFVKQEHFLKSYLRWSDVADSLKTYGESNFFKFLAGRFGRTWADKVAQWYKLGGHGFWKGACVFWQFDINRNIRSGKIMLYDENTGHRVKEPNAKIMWAHRLLPDSRKDDFVLSQCFFGEHLLALAKGKICVVESEKTAIIASICVKGATWIATGGLNNLQPDKCKVLEGRDVVFFPDLGAEDKWAEKIAEIPGLKSARISGFLRSVATPEMIDKSQDIGDYLIDNRDGWRYLADHLRTL